MSGTSEVPAPAAPAVAETAAPAPAPVVAEAAPAVVEAPAPAPAPAPVAPEPVAPAPEPAPVEKSLLETAGEKPPAEKAADKPAEGEPKPPEPTPGPAYDLKLPEGFTVNPKQMTAATELFAKHNVPPEAAQELIDQHVASMKTFAEETRKNQWAVFNKMKEGWKQATLADPELGGAGHKTAMRLVAIGRDALVTQEEMPALLEALTASGVGENAAILRAFYRAGQKFSEAAQPPPNPQPPPNLGRRGGRGDIRDLYTSTAHKTATGRE